MCCAKTVEKIEMPFLGKMSADSSGPKEPGFRWGSTAPYGKGQFWGVRLFEQHLESLLLCGQQKRSFRP